MQKHCVLVSGATISKDSTLIESLGNTCNVLTNQHSKKIESMLASTDVDMIVLEPSSEFLKEIEIIKNIKNRYQNLMIILIDGDRELFVQAFRYGVKDIFRKPYRREMILERVNALLM